MIENQFFFLDFHQLSNHTISAVVPILVSESGYEMLMVITKAMEELIKQLLEMLLKKPEEKEIKARQEKFKAE